MTNDEYLWDGSGTPDPEIVSLEQTLRPLRYRTRAHIRVGLWQAGLAMAAALLLVWAAGPGETLNASGLDVKVLTGSPRAGGNVLAHRDHLVEGQWLVTDSQSAVLIHVGEVGQVRVEPSSRLRIVSTSDSHHRLELQEGMIHSAAWAPSRQFVVETPAGRAVDLGCEYTLAVDGRGHAMLCVETGWVSLERNDRTTLVPSGAQCEMRPGIGPGTPYLAGASSDYVEMLHTFDFEPGTQPSVADLIDKASPCDAFSLVYLVGRVTPTDRGRIFDRVTELYPPWEGITRAGIVALEAAAVTSWQDQFECFETELCRASCLPEWL